MTVPTLPSLDAADLGLTPEDLELYDHCKAKISQPALRCPRRQKVRAAKRFVPQITPPYSSSERSENDEDDTTSRDKNITAIVSVDYAIR